MKKYLTAIFLFVVAAFTMNAQTVNVTFKVDMSVQSAKGAFDSTTDQVEVRGSFNGWDFGDNKYLDDADGDMIYETTLAVNANEELQYKFFHTGGEGTWEDGDNKVVDVQDADIVLDPVFFNGEAMPSGDPAPVTFHVDMTHPNQTGAFDPTQNNIYVAGSFTDWGNEAVEMTDGDGDMVYDVTVDINSAQLIQFKFIWSPQHPSAGDPGTTWESVDNRTLWVFDGEQEFSAFWDDIDPNQELADGNILFEVDMSVMSEVGVFDNAVDAAQVRGGFNGWSDGNPDISHMNQDFADPNDWFLEVPFVQQPVGGEQNYKYYVALADAETMWTDGWERPFSQGGGNRDILFEGTEDQTTGVEMYDDVLPNYVIEDGKVDVAITFSVDMTNATDPNVQALPFNAATDTVYIVFEQPSFIFSQGWVDTDEMRVLQLTDDNGDMVYTGTLNVQAPAWNGFEYRYAYSSPDNGWQAEPAGFGDFAYRVRYIEQNGYRSFVQPYNAPTDTWIGQEDKSAEWEEAPSGVVSVGDENFGTPFKFNLSQNYPNPFNPSTVINFTIPQNGLVTLKVYNLLGQEVATLINKEMNAGSYDYSFNATNLGSGIYFYSLKAGNFTATKKMMLLK